MLWINKPKRAGEQQARVLQNIGINQLIFSKCIREKLEEATKPHLITSFGCLAGSCLNDVNLNATLPGEVWKFYKFYKYKSKFSQYHYYHETKNRILEFKFIH